MPASKIVDDTEVRRWFREGRTYAWMQEQYLQKYNIQTELSMWGNYRRRHGLDRRSTRDDDLIPWAVERKHRWHPLLKMLRFEARRRAGGELDERSERWLNNRLAELREANVVVTYDAERKEGFYTVPRTVQDSDLIRMPGHKTARRNADNDD